MRQWVGWVLVVWVLWLAGCATTDTAPSQALREAARPALSVDTASDELVVAVSPARKTLQFAGSTGFLLGTTVDAVVNARYREAVREALGEFDPSPAFRAHLTDRLNGAVGHGLDPAPPAGSTAGYANAREAREAYCAALGRQGHDVLLEVRLRYGLYGTRPELVMEAEAALVSLPEGRRLWDGSYFVLPRPDLASDKLGEPRGQKRLDASSPQFRVDEAAFARWTADGGTLLRTRFEAGMEAVTAALLTEMGLEQTASGELHLGQRDMRIKRFSDADARFKAALRLDPGLVDARNAQAVNLAHAGQRDDALRLTRQLVQDAPDYGPAWFNLAWWLAVDLGDAEAARAPYDQALRLGMSPDPTVEKALAGY